MKYMAERAKWPLKSGVLGAKSRKLGEQNNGMATKIERRNGAKCRGYTQKRTKTGVRKAEIYP